MILANLVPSFAVFNKKQFFDPIVQHFTSEVKSIKSLGYLLVIQLHFGIACNVVDLKYTLRLGLESRNSIIKSLEYLVVASDDWIIDVDLHLSDDDRYTSRDKLVVLVEEISFFEENFASWGFHYLEGNVGIHYYYFIGQ